MLRPPPANGHVVDRHIHKADNAHHRCQDCRTPGIDDVASQHEVGDKQKPQNEGEGQARVPCPPDTPGGFCPQGAGDDYAGAEDKPYFRRAVGELIRGLTAILQISNATNKNQEIGQHCRPGRRYVDVEDALHFAHGRFLRRIKKDQIRGHNQPDKRDDKMQPEREDFTHALSLVPCPLSLVTCPLSLVTCPLSVVRCQWSVVRGWRSTKFENRNLQRFSSFKFRLSVLSSNGPRTKDQCLRPILLKHIQTTNMTTPQR